MIFMSVDLPAPFSPSTAWISPGRTRRFTSSLALTAGYCLLMPRSSRRSGSSVAGGGGELMACLRVRAVEVAGGARVFPRSGHPGVDEVAFVAQRHPGEDALVQVAREPVAVLGHRADGPVPHREVGRRAGVEAADL